MLALKELIIILHPQTFPLQKSSLNIKYSFYFTF